MAIVYKTKRSHPDLWQHILQLRGLNEDDLDLDFEAGLHDPYLFKDMDRACQLVKETKERQESIYIFGDYDADGIPASVLLSDVFDELGIKHTVRIPNRKEGYGLNRDIVVEASRYGQILICVDNGITAIDEIAEAKRLGLKTIILDHHLPKEVLPMADAIIDAFVPGSKYPFQGLCGCGVAYKLAVALSRYFPEISERKLKWWLDLVAISTISDMVPMRDENRVLTKYGLIVLAKTKRLGLNALFNRAKISREKIDSFAVGYMIGPRINAVGRLGSDNDAFLLLKTKDFNEAEELSQKIEKVNTSRQQAVDDFIKLAEESIWQQNRQEDKIYTLYLEDAPIGVIGLVAGKVAQKYTRPVVVVTNVDGEFRGSARSYDYYHIVDAFSRVNQYLGHYGGHSQAAGLSLAKSKWQDFCRMLKADANKHISDQDLLPIYIAEAEISVEDLKITTIKRLAKLEPYGQLNPKPRFLISDATIKSSRMMGKNQNHQKLELDMNGKELEAVFFNCANSSLKRGDKLTALGSLELNEWNGSSRIQFSIYETFDASVKIETISDAEAKNKLHLY